MDTASSSGTRILDQPPITSSSLPPRSKPDHGSQALKPSRPQDAVDKRSWSYIVRSGVAGGLAGCAAKTVVGPLDRVKILFQASNPQFAKYTGSWFGVAIAMRDIYWTDGLRGLFRGHSATLLRVFPYAGIKFLAYEQIRAVAIPNPSKETPFRRFASGSLAGITSVFFTYPLEVIRVRLAFETKRDSRSSLGRICRQIYHEQPPEARARAPHRPVATAETAGRSAAPSSGLVNFYRGFGTTLIGMVPYAGMSFLTHDWFGDLFRRPELAPSAVLAHPVPSPGHDRPAERAPNKPDRRAPLTAPAELTAGAMAGLISQTASYPFEVIRRRMQVGGAVGDGRRMAIGETARTIFRERGLRGFFVGLTIGYVKVVPMVATSFYVYERLKWAFDINH